jgi:hypothetical protein
MATTVTPPSVIKVQVGSQQSGAVSTINQARSAIKDSSDFFLGTPQEGDVLVYHTSNGNFTLASISASSKVSRTGDTMTGSLILSGAGTDLKFSSGSSLVGNEANNLIKITANANNDITGVAVQSNDGGVAQVYSNGRVEIITDTGAAGALWTFNRNGSLTFPNGTIQTTAFTGYATDNTARTTANSAYTQANTANTVAVSSYAQANAATIIAQAAYAQANSGAGSAFTQAAFNQANTANTVAISGYLQANTATTIGQAAFARANSEIIGTAAYVQANTATTIGQSAYVQANTSNTVAIEAYVQANTATIIGQAAFARANSEIIGTAAYVQANTSNTVAIAAYVQANVATIIGQAAYVQANTATTIGQAAYIQANTSNTVAIASYVQANTATIIGQAAYAAANTKLPLSGGTIAGSLVIQNNLTVQGNVSYTGNVTSISVTGNTGQFFGYASNGFNALYAGIPTGYFLEPQISFQISSNYNGYSGLNMQNINTGANASSDLFITADNGTVNDGFLDLGFSSSTYAYPGYTLIGKNDGYLFAVGNTTTGGGNMIVGTGLNNDVIFSVGGINTENEIARFKYNTGLVLKQFPIKFADNTSQNTAAAPFAVTNASFTQANTATIIGQAAYVQANTATTIGQASYTQANTATTIGQAAYVQANTSNTVAIAAYVQANTATIIGQAAYAAANTKLPLVGGTVTGNLIISTTGYIVIQNTQSSISNTSGTITISGAGGIGVGGSIYVGNRVGFSNSTSVSAAYQVYNQAVNGIDTVFG